MNAENGHTALQAHSYNKVPRLDNPKIRIVALSTGSLCMRKYNNPIELHILRKWDNFSG